MKINFTIPDVEPIDVEITRNWLTGSFKFIANGVAYEMRSPLSLGTHFSISTKHEYLVDLGGHLVEIEHSRPRFLGGLRPQRYIVKVDGKVVADKTGF